MELSKSYLTELIYQVNGAAIEVHQAMGPGLLESVYHKFMKHELNLRGINFESEMVIPIEFKGETMDTSLRCDLFIEGILPVELKASQNKPPSEITNTKKTISANNERVVNVVAPFSL